MSLVMISFVEEIWISFGIVLKTFAKFQCDVKKYDISKINTNRTFLESPHLVYEQIWDQL